MHASEFPKKFDPGSAPSVVVLQGDERHLKLSVLDELSGHLLDSPAADAIGLIRFSGKEVDYRSVHDELALISMFSSQKIVLVEAADEFVTSARPQLERYVDQPSRRSLLVLDVKTWRKNTKLAKKVAQQGLAVECTELTGGRLTSWLIALTQAEYDKQLTRDAAQLMTELAGTGMGLLAQELGKLASYVGDRSRINVDDVRTLVGGWKAETTWTMINAVRDGNMDLALNCLHKLLYAGEAAPRILGGINFVFKKLAEATERSRQGQSLRAALKDAGVFPRDIDPAEKYLRRVRRPRAERILEHLALTDYGLKGGSRLPEQMQLEQLLLWLGGAISE